MNSSLREFAEAPDAYLAPAPGVRIVDGERFYATLSGDGRWISVCRLGFAPEAASSVLAEIRALRPGAQTSWQTPDAKLAGALRAAGCRAPDPPLQPLFTALATDPDPCTIRVGVAALTARDTATELIEHADAALPPSTRR